MSHLRAVACAFPIHDSDDELERDGADAGDSVVLAAALAWW